MAYQTLVGHYDARCRLSEGELLKVAASVFLKDSRFMEILEHGWHKALDGFKQITHDLADLPVGVLRRPHEEDVPPLAEVCRDDDLGLRPDGQNLPGILRLPSCPAERPVEPLNFGKHLGQRHGASISQVHLLMRVPMGWSDALKLELLQVNLALGIVHIAGGLL